MLRLREASPDAWLGAVLDDFDAFLLDHAACERKASAMALSFVSHYPDRKLLVREMIELAQEELEHFAVVYGEIERRGLMLLPDEKDGYVNALRKRVRGGRDAFFLDQLLVAGVVEARGCERFGMVWRALDDGPVKEMYGELTRAEARHHGLFVRLAQEYFDENMVRSRLDELLDAEVRIMRELPLRACVH